MASLGHDKFNTLSVNTGIQFWQLTVSIYMCPEMSTSWYLIEVTNIFYKARLKHEFDMIHIYVLNVFDGVDILGLTKWIKFIGLEYVKYQIRFMHSKSNKACLQMLCHWKLLPWMNISISKPFENIHQNTGFYSSIIWLSRLKQPNNI